MRRPRCPRTDVPPPAAQVVREASKRVLGLRPFDVQLMGGMILHDGQIAEMRTGEGKTLVAVLPAYLNALSGRGVHVVTVNDYLARRDSEWVGQVHRFLGLDVGLVQQGLSVSAAAAASRCRCCCCCMAGPLTFTTSCCLTTSPPRPAPPRPAGAAAQGGVRRRRDLRHQLGARL